VSAHDFLRDPLPPGLADLPALMHPAERQLLYNLARHHCSGRGEVVELGAFFGGSAAALAAGLKDRGAAGRVRTFDRFDCASGSAFAGLVQRFAAAHEIDFLLAERDGRLDFFGCFEDVTYPYAAWISATRAELSELKWEGSVELLHVDMPKTYAQLREAVRRVYAHLLPSAFVVLQDYVYHWSAELIAATMAMRRRGLVAPATLVETSLVLRAARAPDAADAAWLDAQIDDPAGVIRLLDEAQAELDGSTHAGTVLRLAAAQYRVAHGMAAEGEARIEEVLAQARSAPFAADVEARVREMRKHGFVMPE